MREKSRLVALSSMMVALGTAVMLLGGALPLQTFAAPALAGIMLLPVLYEFGAKWALSAYAAIVLLGLMLSPDKEAALLFAFLGYYPVLKKTIDSKLRARPVRIAVKLLVFNVAAGAMLFCAVRLFGLDAIMDEYAEMSRAMLCSFIVLSNVTLLLYDVALRVMLFRYIVRLRPRS